MPKSAVKVVRRGMAILSTVAPSCSISCAALCTTTLTSSWIASVPSKAVTRPMRAPRKPVAIKGGDVAVRLLPPSKGGNGIVRVIRRHDVQHACGVRDGTCHGTGFVLRAADGENAAAAHEAARGTDADQALRRMGRKCKRHCSAGTAACP